MANPKGLQCVVDGTIPKSAGLSSSSALVCCAALATMHANNQSLTKVFLKTILLLFFLFLACLTVGYIFIIFLITTEVKILYENSRQFPFDSL